MEMSASQYIAIVIALISCVTDVRTRRIPNVLTFGGALAGVAFHTLNAGPAGSLQSITGWAAGVAVFFLPFALGGMGAGDVKLVAALGAWLGPADTLTLAIYSVLLAGVAAVVVSMRHAYLRQALANVGRLLGYWRVVGLRPLPEVSLDSGTGPRLAYAVPVFAGLVTTIWLH
jgi:prepilin peptidase CpaA